MYPRLECEMAKLIQIENGWNVMIWDPEPPPAVPDQSPCAQQPMRFWKTYSYPTLNDAIAFLHRSLSKLAPHSER